MRTNTRAQQRRAVALSRLPPGPLRQVDLAEFTVVPRRLIRAWSNNRFSVQLYETELDSWLRISVRRHDEGEITWDELQAIKDFVIGPHERAIEYYPRSPDVVNVANMRHLWVVPHDFPLPSFEL